MIDVEIVPKAAPVDHPNEIAVKGFAGLPFGVGHRRMLDFDDDAGRCLDIGSVDLTVGGHMRNLPALGWEEVLPRPMPLGFILPPWVAIAPFGMRPMVQDPRAAFGDQRRAARRAKSATARNGLAAQAIDYRILHRWPPMLIVLYRRQDARRDPTARATRPLSEPRRHGPHNRHRPCDSYRQIAP